MELELPFKSEIPDRYTQYGRNISPKIEVKDVPEEAETLVLIFENIDAPPSISVHWIIWNVPADREVLPEAIVRDERPEVVNGAIQGNNDFDVLGYQGPKLFPGEETYLFTLYALDTKLNLSPGEKKEQVMEAMRGNVVDKTQKERGYTS